MHVCMYVCMYAYSACENKSVKFDTKNCRVSLCDSQSRTNVPVTTFVRCCETTAAPDMVLPALVGPIHSKQYPLFSYSSTLTHLFLNILPLSQHQRVTTDSPHRILNPLGTSPTPPLHFLLLHSPPSSERRAKANPLTLLVDTTLAAVPDKRCHRPHASPTSNVQLLLYSWERDMHAWLWLPTTSEEE